MPKTGLLIRRGLCALLALPALASADPFAAPGDTALRADLQYLNDTGTINIPLTAWPLSFGDVAAAVNGVATNDDAVANTLGRVRERVRWESQQRNWRLDFGASAADQPRIIRSFENTPRAGAEGYLSLNYVGERFALNIAGRAIADPADGDEFRPDGTYVGVALGNWMLSAGWQERWWGPGNNGSLILSSNARPAPGLTLQRNNSQPFETRWLSWLGPWTFVTFMDWLDDDRTVTDALHFGARFSFRPVRGLEIGLSRTAQWCGKGRPCDVSAFWDMLVGNDNPGVNVNPEDEPGNQLAGIDLRWTLPRNIPATLYMQWIGEDGRGGKALPGSWLRSGGVEVFGTIGGLRHTTYVEVADTACHDGGLGGAEVQPNCAYNHSIYQTGYRYRERVMGYGSDGDSLVYALGSTLVQSDGHSWNVLLRRMEINRYGASDPQHSISSTPLDISDLQVSYERLTRLGTFRLGLGYERREDTSGALSSGSTAFLQWSNR